MTNFNKIKEYYKSFDEKNRLQNDNSGKLEYMMTMKILDEYLPQNGVILDLGGGAGAYTYPLADKGYKVYLADLSETLINQAKEEAYSKNIIAYDVINATDLGRYENNQFDVVLLFGPLYHLLEVEERKKCLTEVNRVLKPRGKVFASFIPYLSGSIGIVDRYFRHPEQVDANNLQAVFKTGKFNNLSDKGFQEGYYPSTNELEKLFMENGFDKILIRSIRGFGYEKEDELYKLENKELYNKIIELINETAENPSIIDMCGHAIYIGCKRN